MKWREPRIGKAIPWAVAGAVAIGGLFLTANVATSVFIEQSLIRPKRKKNKTSDLADFIPEANYSTTPIRFLSTDGFWISALLLEPEKANGHAVVICHGIAHDKRSGIRFVQYLLKEGYTLLSIDFRNHGESEGSITTYGYHEKEDLLAAVRYLRNPVGIAGRIGVLGASMGASIAIQAAAESDQIGALVLDSPFASLKQVSLESVARITRLPRFMLYVPMSLAFFWTRLFYQFRVWDVEPSQKVQQVHCPILLIHGTADSRIGVHHSFDIYSKAKSQKELWIVENVGHLGAYLTRPLEYQKRVLSFFRRHLMGEPAHV